MLKKLVKEELRPVNFKIAPSEYEKLEEKAKQYTNGNVSEWIRYAALNHKPSKSELANEN